jgi:hypothetical protein
VSTNRLNPADILQQIFGKRGNKNIAAAYRTTGIDARNSGASKRSLRDGEPKANEAGKRSDV